jgi:hypothetical protein
LAEDTPVKGRVVGDERPAREHRLEGRENGLRARRVLEHLLGYPGKPANASTQWRARAHERGPALMELAAADEHDPDLDQLACIAAEAVGLGIDNHELGCGQSLIEKFQGGGNTPRSGRQANRLAAATPESGVLDLSLEG